MPDSHPGHIEHLREELSKNLRLYFFEEKEIDDVLKDLDSFDRRLRHRAFALCYFLSSASAYLIPRALRHIKEASRKLSVKDMERWIGNVFDLLDAEGIEGAVGFLTKTDIDDLRRFETPKGLRLQTVSHVLQTYLRGISGMELKIGHDKDSYTDTVTVYLPPLIQAFKEPEKNFLLYKLMATHKWAQIRWGSLTPDLSPITPMLKKYKLPHADIEALFKVFPERPLALDIYNLLEAFRLEGLMRKELSGIVKDSAAIKAEVFKERPNLDGFSSSQKTAFVEAMYQHYLRGRTKGEPPLIFKAGLKKAQALGRGGTTRKTVNALVSVYEMAAALKGVYAPEGPMLYLGSIKPEKVSHQLKAKKQSLRKKLELMVTKLINMPDFHPQTRPPFHILPPKNERGPERQYLMIRGRLIELDDELRNLIDEMGGFPGGILVDGGDIGSGSAYVTLRELIEAEEGEALAGGTRYDEWDYRRADYRKRWCNLFEQDIHPGHEPFVEQTLGRYRGYVSILRKKFELLKKHPRLLRRQTEGEDIDIDGVVEAFSDIHAGLSPHENFFIKRDRMERDIAVLFLLDMSGSTKGWINQAEKESLVLMCEALDALGDRYAVYGFSGMTRSRCDFYRIKGFEEPYSGEVKDRIAGILPKDYTRMGPAIRHSTAILKAIEARTKLLITLSDGKPEDYDAYKGVYGIEDTRKALIEAKEHGIHSFCITIDKEASSYLPHMYGEVNYIFIDDVSKLPARITEIYRRLTT